MQDVAAVVKATAGTREHLGSFLRPKSLGKVGGPIVGSLPGEGSPRSPRLPVWSQANGSSFCSQSCRKEGRGDLQVINSSTSCEEGGRTGNREV